MTEESHNFSGRFGGFHYGLLAALRAIEGRQHGCKPPAIPLYMPEMLKRIRDNPTVSVFRDAVAMGEPAEPLRYDGVVLNWDRERRVLSAEADPASGKTMEPLAFDLSDAALARGREKMRQDLCPPAAEHEMVESS